MDPGRHSAQCIYLLEAMLRGTGVFDNPHPKSKKALHRPSYPGHQPFEKPIIRSLSAYHDAVLVPVEQNERRFQPCRSQKARKSGSQTGLLNRPSTMTDQMQCKSCGDQSADRYSPSPPGSSSCTTAKTPKKQCNTNMRSAHGTRYQKLPVEALDQARVSCICWSKPSIFKGRDANFSKT